MNFAYTNVVGAFCTNRNALLWSQCFECGLWYLLVRIFFQKVRMYWIHV